MVQVRRLRQHNRAYWAVKLCVAAEIHDANPVLHLVREQLAAPETAVVAAIASTAVAGAVRAAAAAILHSRRGR